MIKVTEKAGAITFAVRVQPRAPESVIVGELEGALKIRLAAPPVDGAANAELIKVIAALFEIGRNQVEIRAGVSGRHKLVRVHDCSAADALRVLASVKPVSDE